jgi:hypothetical protein
MSRARATVFDDRSEHAPYTAISVYPARGHLTRWTDGRSKVVHKVRGALLAGNLFECVVQIRDDLIVLDVMNGLKPTVIAQFKTL